MEALHKPCNNIPFQYVIYCIFSLAKESCGNIQNIESTDTHIATIIFLCVVECHMGVHACILRILEHTEFYTNGFDFLAAKHAKNI